MRMYTLHVLYKRFVDSLQLLSDLTCYCYCDCLVIFCLGLPSHLGGRLALARLLRPLLRFLDDVIVVV